MITKFRISQLLQVLCILTISNPFQLVYGNEQFSWKAFDQILKTYVKEGEYQGVRANLVNYQALIGNKDFENISLQLHDYDPSGLTQNEKLSFYINAYNYFALKIVVDNWPVDEIKDIGSFFSPVWKKTVGAINQKKITLDQIEHDILRPMGEPRIHFAIVCSSMSCPDIRTEIYQPDILDEQLKQQTQQFLNNETKGAAIKRGELYLSQIFDWFEEDFENDDGVIKFISTFNPQFSDKNSFKTLNYNWKLNLQRD